VRVVHLKDGHLSKTLGGHDAQGRSVGAGDAPVKAVREKALEQGWLMVIESEGLDPTGPEEVGRCISFLRTLD
jgi:sugar phosphate isomerase/epimerase